VSNSNKAKKVRRSLRAQKVVSPELPKPKQL